MLATHLGSGKARLAICALLLFGLGALAARAAASAAILEVNDKGNEPDKDPGAPCETVVGTCTVRAAILASNSTVGPDEIVFAPNPFDGQVADSINVPVGEPLPPITDGVVIDGVAKGAANGQCITEAGIAGPCVGLNTLSGLVVQADDVTIDGLAIAALTGIHVQGESQNFAARGNWIGINLKGERTFTLTGIFVDRGADFALIGGRELKDRNVIAGNEAVGLDIQGASQASVLGNYFGVGADGTTPIPNRVDVEVTDSTTAPPLSAAGTEIGTTVSDEAVDSAACDGGCNVIASGLVGGIDLKADVGEEEAPATGSTEIHGNFIGLKANGTEAVGPGDIGIQAVEAGSVRIGGSAEGDANFFAGGNIAIDATRSPVLLVRGNAIGLNSLGNGPVTPPGEIGIAVSSLELGETEGALIRENAVRMNPSVGIGISHDDGPGAAILDNAITGGIFGIRTAGDASEGNLIALNEVSGATAGIQLDSDDNRVVNNDVFENDLAGIRLAANAPTASGNVIGGDEPGSENTISDNEGPAIENQNVEASQNEIGRNHGEGNAGLFIDLVDSSSAPFGPNGGIEPPAVATALQSTASGTALPGARVRVFRKASADPGELESFLGEAVADGSGSWKVSYQSQLPAGTIVAATQTNTLGGTSELRAVASAPDPRPPVCACLPPPPPPKPQIKILKAPQAKSSSTTAKFSFTSTVPGSRFECRLDKGKFAKCRSPKTYRNLEPGKHVFRVRAIDAAGTVGPVAKRRFTVLAK